MAKKRPPRNPPPIPAVKDSTAEQIAVSQRGLGASFYAPPLITSAGPRGGNQSQPSPSTAVAGANAGAGPRADGVAQLLGVSAQGQVGSVTPTITNAVGPGREEPVQPSRLRTAVGKSFERNRIVVVLQIDALQMIIHEEIGRIHDRPANYPDTQAAQVKEIATLNAIQQRLNAIRDTAVRLANLPEADIQRAAKSFSDYVWEWFVKDHVEICKTAYQAAIFAVCASICMLIDSGGPIGAVISGAIATGGKPLTAALKAGAQFLKRGK
jgi:hypothetical protein